MLMGVFPVSMLYYPMFLIKSYIVGFHVKTSYVLVLYLPL